MAEPHRDSLSALEALVTRFRERHDQIRSERCALAERLARVESDVQRALRHLRVFERERNEIKQRLERLLSRLATLEE
jgi:septal ring factor EnvC (AmiA/AmiB activator)